MVRRWVPALALGGAWWWAVLRLALQPEHTGLVEGAVAAGGWGLSLLPVHAAATARSGHAMRRQGGKTTRISRGTVRRLISEASPRRRSGGGPDRS